MLVDLLWSADLLYSSLIEDDDAITHTHRLFLVMGYEDEGDAGFTLDALEFDLHLLAQLTIQSTEWFIKEEDLGSQDQCSSESDALTLSTGELVWEAICDMSQLH